MCYASGSIEQVTACCIMCKVYPPRQVGCPHLPLGLCRNRQNHPRFDVVHFRTAELDLFNGCGYCKWASQNNALSNDKTWFNTGWPGCCRPPKPTEYIYIKGLNEWLAVNKIHGTPIPLDAGQASATNSIRGLTSPKRDQARPSLAHVVCGFEKLPSNSPNASTSVAASTLRRKRSKSVTQSIEKEPENLTRIPLTGKNPNLQILLTDSKSFPNLQTSPSLKMKRPLEEKEKLLHAMSNHLIPSNTLAVRAASVSTSSSRSSSSVADSVTTVTSEGFTDYLSDESDQELQRQAEARAAELAIAKHEKDEFDAALQTVRHLSLQPPPEWNPQLPVSRPSTRYPRESFTGPQSFQVAIGHSRQ